MKQDRFPPNFEVKVGIHGVGVFVLNDVNKGDVLFKMKGDVISAPTRTSVQIGKNKHIEDALAGHMNHSCTPNAKVNKRSRSFVSLRNIKKGEEITFDYNKNEDALASPFQCVCCGRQMLGKQAATSRGKSKLLTTS